MLFLAPKSTRVDPPRELDSAELKFAVVSTEVATGGDAACRRRRSGRSGGRACNRSLSRGRHHLPALPRRKRQRDHGYMARLARGRVVSRLLRVRRSSLARRHGAL